LILHVRVPACIEITSRFRDADAGLGQTERGQTERGQTERGQTEQVKQILQRRMAKIFRKISLFRIVLAWQFATVASEAFTHGRSGSIL
jgi:hypothetical protein